MDNITMQVDDNGILLITVDTKRAGKLSGSGKSTVIASTRGNAEVPGTDLKIGLNLFRKVL